MATRWATTIAKEKHTFFNLADSLPVLCWRLDCLIYCIVLSNRNVVSRLFLISTALWLYIFLSMCDVKVSLTFTSLSLVLLLQLFYLFCSSIVINNVIATAGNFERSERGRFGALKSDSTHHIFRNACTKLGSLQFSVFRLLTDFVCLYNYEFWLSLYKIVRSSVILLLPLFISFISS